MPARDNQVTIQPLLALQGFSHSSRRNSRLVSSRCWAVSIVVSVPTIPGVECAAQFQRAGASQNASGRAAFSKLLKQPLHRHAASAASTYAIARPRAARSVIPVFWKRS